MNPIDLYEFCLNTVEVSKYEKVQDSYGNRIESFVILDDLTLCFCFNNKDELLNCWYC